MLRVKTHLEKSKISGAGVGLHASENLKRGTIIWVFDKGFDRIVKKKKFKKLPKFITEEFKKYCTKEGKKYFYCVDNARFMNHADVPSTVSAGDNTVAARDIKVNEELTCNYWEIDDSVGPQLRNNQGKKIFRDTGAKSKTDKRARKK